MADNVQKRIRIGDLLIDREIITKQQLETALIEQRSSGQKLGRALIDLGYITEKDILDALSAQMNIPYVDLEQFKFKPELVKRFCGHRHASRCAWPSSDDERVGSGGH